MYCHLLGGDAALMSQLLLPTAQEIPPSMSPSNASTHPAKCSFGSGIPALSLYSTAQPIVSYDLAEITTS
eukprot:1518685-Amphidinium_carterae.1